MLTRLRDVIVQSRSELGSRCEGVKVWSVLDANGRVLAMGEKERQCVLGSKPRSINQSIIDLCHPDDIEELMNTMRLMRAQKVSSECTFRVQHADGHWVQVRGFAMPLIENSEISGYVTVFAKRPDVRLTSVISYLQSINAHAHT